MAVWYYMIYIQWTYYVYCIYSFFLFFPSMNRDHSITGSVGRGGRECPFIKILIHFVRLSVMYKHLSFGGETSQARRAVKLHIMKRIKWVTRPSPPQKKIAPVQTELYRCGLIGRGEIDSSMLSRATGCSKNMSYYLRGKVFFSVKQLKT